MTSTESKVFLSSTRKDLQSYRDLATEILNSHDIRVHRQEDSPDDGQRNDATEFSTDLMEDGCTWYLGIVAFRYGHSSDTGKSITQAEYEYARTLLDREIYNYVFVMLAESPDSFDETENIRVHASQGQTSPSDYKKQMEFRDKLNNDVLTLFNSRNEFQKKLEKIIAANILGKTNSTKDSLLESYKGLSQSQKRLRDSSKEAIEALRCVQRYKDLHFLTHQFRKEILTPVTKAIYTPKTVDSVDRTLGQVSSRALRRFRDKDEPLNIFVYEAEQTREKLVRDLVRNVLYEVDDIKESKALFRVDYDERPEEFVSQLGELHKHLDFILEECDQGITDYTEKFRDPAERALNMLQELINTGLWESASISRQKKKMRNDLDDTRELRVQLVQCVRIHRCWQNSHGKLAKLDRSRSDIWSCDSNGDPLTRRLVDRFIEDLDDELSDNGKNKPGKLLDRLCPDNVDLLVGIRKDQFVSALKDFTTALHEFKESTDKYDLRSGTSLSIFFDEYDRYRESFDNAFFHVGRSMRDRCHKEAEWIDPLYGLLDDIHTCLEEQEQILLKEEAHER